MRPRTVMMEGVIVLIAVLIVGAGTHEIVLGDNVASRMASVYSLVNDGTWQIDRAPDRKPNPFEQRTVDKVQIDGRLVSTKPPLLPLMMAGEYWLLKQALGWDLNKKSDTIKTMRVMALTFSVSSFLLLLLVFRAILSLLEINAQGRILALLAVALATPLPGFATQINNHVPGTALMVLAIYLMITLGREEGSPARSRFFLFGLVSGLVFTLDMPLTIFVACAGLYLLYKKPGPSLRWAFPGILLPLLVHFTIMGLVTGSLLPVQMRPDLYQFEGGYWCTPGGLDALHEPKWLYGFHMFFGRFGLFLLFPVLLTGVSGWVKALQNQAQPLRHMLLASLLPSGILVSYYLFKTENYGGSAYGVRWLMGLVPLLLLLGAPLLQHIRKPWQWGVLIIALVISGYSAWECFQMPWGYCHEWTCRWLFGEPG